MGFPELCNVGVPCSAAYINWLGFITIPMLSLIAFLLIGLLMLMARQAPQEADEAE